MLAIKPDEIEREAKAEWLGIVIVHFGDNKLRTAKCLDSFIKASSWLKENKPFIKISIIVADNSGNLDQENFKSSCCEIRHFNLGKNLGYAGACYEAAKLLPECSILMFSNNDIILRETSLLILLETMESLPDVGAIQPLVLIEGSSKVDSMGMTSNALMQGFNYSNWPIKPIRTFVLENKLKVLESFGFDGMLFMLRRRTWEEVKGWDPRFFMFNEDSLLSWKLRMRGYTNYVALNSVVYHERGGTAEGYYLKKNPLFSSYYTSRNKMLSVLYIYEGTWLIIYFFASILFELVKNFMLSVKNRSALNLYYYCKALTFVLSNRRHVISERSNIFRKIGPRSFVKQGYTLPLLTSLAWLLKRRNDILE
jgi:N-acetylglucosaminyl-diphospho-decaprenol L-rhamnosyltransferase